MKGDLLMGFENKQTLLFRLYQVLFDYSDENNLLTQQDIIDILEREYGLVVERKAIGRNISYLNEMGIDVESSRKGAYLVDRPIEKSELHMLIDSVLCSTHISATHSKQLIDKLVRMGGRNFKSNVRYVQSLNDWNKTENKAVFFNISVIDDAISQGKQIKFYYNKIGADKQLHHTSRPCVSPYRMVLHNQHYYLMGCNHKWMNISFYRLDKITEIEIIDQPTVPIKSLDGYKNGINYKELSTARPYMFTDKPEKVVISAKKWMMDDIVDWFGKDVKVSTIDDENIKVELIVSPTAMKFWALQYGENAEVLAPEHLRNEIRQSIEQMCEKYKRGC